MSFSNHWSQLCAARSQVVGTAELLLQRVLLQAFSKPAERRKLWAALMHVLWQSVGGVLHLLVEMFTSRAEVLQQYSKDP